MNLKSGTKLTHYKGGKYTVLGQGTHSETLENMIVYQNESDKKVWIRPLNMFYEVVEYKGYTVPRFVAEVKQVRNKEDKKELVQKAIKDCMEQNHELFKRLAKE